MRNRILPLTERSRSQTPRGIGQLPEQTLRDVRRIGHDKLGPPGVVGARRRFEQPNNQADDNDAVPCMKGRSSALNTLLTKRKNIGTPSPRLMHRRVRMNGGGLFIHDTLDRVSAAATLGAASEAGIDLAHAGPSRLLCDN